MTPVYLFIIAKPSNFFWSGGTTALFAERAEVGNAGQLQFFMNGKLRAEFAQGSWQRYETAGGPYHSGEEIMACPYVPTDLKQIIKKAMAI